MVKKMILELTAMYFFAQFLAEKNEVGFEIEEPSKFLARTKDAYALFIRYSVGLAYFMDGYTTSARFGRWVGEWNRNSRNKSKRPYSQSEWVFLIRQYSDPDGAFEVFEGYD